MNNLPNIRRVKYGWQFHTARGGSLQTRFFSDREFGGKKRARSSAVVYRDSMMIGLERKPAKLHSDNKTGFNRIHITSEPLGGGGTYDRVRASVKLESGLVFRKSWPLSRYGKDEAIQKAVKWQKKIKS